MTDIEDIGQVARFVRGEGWALDAVALLVIAVVVIPLGAAIFGLGLRAARRSGSLGEY